MGSPRNHMTTARSLAAATAISALLLFIAAPHAHAFDDKDKCRHRIEKAEARLDDAIRRHGEASHEAADRRRDLNAEREHCWNTYHTWWNGHDNQWHSERDWDRDNDRDRDNDHH